MPSLTHLIERGEDGALYPAEGNGGGETSYEEEVERRKNETTWEVLAGGKSQELQKDQLLSVTSFIERQKVEMPDFSRIGFTIGRDYYQVCRECSIEGVAITIRCRECSIEGVAITIRYRGCSILHTPAYSLTHTNTTGAL
jgi:hypothetical protein